MVRRESSESEIREQAVAYGDGGVPASLEKLPPFYYGFRPRRTRDAEGREVIEDVPLTPEDYLHPREGDLMTQGNPHERMVSRLADAIRRWLEKKPGFGVFSDVLVRWGVEDLPAQAPDVTVMSGLADPAAVEGSLDCAALGSAPDLAIELVSTTHKEYREKDLQDKVRIYEQGGVAEYLIVDPTGCGRGEPFQLTGYRLDEAGSYRRIFPDERGSLLSESTGLRLVPDAERGVVVEVAESGERLLFSDEVAEALQAAEEQVSNEATARREAEERVEAEAEARRAAERRVAEAEEKLARLLAERTAD